MVVFFGHTSSINPVAFQTPGRIQKGRSPNSGLNNSHGVEYRTLRWIYFVDPPRDLGLVQQNLARDVGSSTPLYSTYPPKYSIIELLCYLGLMKDIRAAELARDFGSSYSL